MTTLRDADPMAGTWLYTVGVGGTTYGLVGEYRVDNLPDQMSGLCALLTSAPEATEIAWKVPINRTHYEHHVLAFRPEAEKEETCQITRTAQTNTHGDLNFPAHDVCPSTAQKPKHSKKRASTRQATPQ